MDFNWNSSALSEAYPSSSQQIPLCGMDFNASSSAAMWAIATISQQIPLCGKRLRAERDRLGIDQQGLADRLGSCPPTRAAGRGRRRCWWGGWRWIVVG